MKYLKKLDSEILLVGGYPPPFGGITIHIQRLLDRCLAENLPAQVISQFTSKIEDRVIGIEGNIVAQFFRLLITVTKYRGKIIHFHTSNLKRFLYIAFPLVFFAQHKKLIFTAHSGDITNTTGIRRILIKLLINQFDYIIAINKQQHRFFSELHKNCENVKLIPSFIPPPKDFVNKTSRHTDMVHDLRQRADVLLLMSGYAKPHYGYDLALEVIEKFTQCSLGVIFVFYTDEEYSYKESLLKRIKSNQNMRVLENLNTEEFLSLLTEIDIYLRPNEIDSYGMVIPESLSFGKIVIASDVCSRHPGAHIFTSGEAESLASVLKNVIINLDSEFEKLNDIVINDYSNDIIDIYKKIILEN